MIYPNNFEAKVGFDTIRKVIESYCMSPLGVAHTKNMEFCAHYDTVLRMLSETNEFLSIITTQEEFPLNNFHDATQHCTAFVLLARICRPTNSSNFANLLAQ